MLSRFYLRLSLCSTSCPSGGALVLILVLCVRYGGVRVTTAVSLEEEYLLSWYTIHRVALATWCCLRSIYRFYLICQVPKHGSRSHWDTTPPSTPCAVLCRLLAEELLTANEAFACSDFSSHTTTVIQDVSQRKRRDDQWKISAKEIEVLQHLKWTIAL